MYDYHIHTGHSDDTDSLITDMIEAAIAKNLERIAITDHMDPFFPGNPAPFFLDLPTYTKSLEEMLATYSDQIRIAKGIEIGLMPGKALDVCEEVVSGYDFDFVVAGLHCTERLPIHLKEFIEGRTTADVIDEYYSDLYSSIKKYKNYDVLAHLNVIDRYTAEFADEKMYMPYVDEILKQAISDGKGIEINTSSFRYGLGERTTPPQIVLNRFVELGGEIITIGSDAHTPDVVGADIEKGEQMLLASGLKYIATFMNRKPEFTKL